MTDIDTLADQHWQYIRALLIQHGEDLCTVEKIGFHYKSAMKHGWKHAVERMSIFRTERLRI